MRYAVILPLFLLLICKVLCADTILLKDGQELKGVIVEDYRDRVVFSTEKGEMRLLKSNIEKIDYDGLEENLARLNAYNLSPDMKKAKGAGGPAPARIDELWEGIGIGIEPAGPDIKVIRILGKSKAAEAGIEEGDVIVSIGGRLVRYMRIEDVYDLFLHGRVSELKVAVSRPKTVILRRNHIFRGAEYMLGARLVVEFEGLTAGEVEDGAPFNKAGILKKDRITRLAGISTMHMPLETAYKLIEGMKDDILYLDCQREIALKR